jgi:hypothetical protein
MVDYVTVVDAFKGHFTPEVKRKVTSLNTDSVVICKTSQLQVYDVFVTKPFKDHLIRPYCEWLL